MTLFNCSTSTTSTSTTSSTSSARIVNNVLANTDCFLGTNILHVIFAGLLLILGVLYGHLINTLFYESNHIAKNIEARYALFSF